MYSQLRSKIVRTIISASASVAVSGFYGCSLSETGITFSDFRQQVERNSGINAVDCGITNGSQSSLPLNICIANAFGNSEAAFSVYRTQGIDSNTADALSITRSGNVFFYSFDSDPNGNGSNQNGQVIRRQCVDPQLSGTVDSSAFNVFVCRN